MYMQWKRKKIVSNVHVIIGALIASVSIKENKWWQQYVRQRNPHWEKYEVKRVLDKRQATAKQWYGIADKRRRQIRAA